MIVRAARYLGVPPWELEERSTMWTYRAITAENAESWAEAERAQRSRDRNKRK